MNTKVVISAGALGRAMWHNPESQEAQRSAAALANGRTGITATVTRAGNLSAAGKFMWPIPERGLSKRLPLIKALSLVVLGATDGLIGRPYGDAFVRAIPGAKLVTIDDAGHMLPFERPDAFLETVEPFLQG